MSPEKSRPIGARLGPRIALLLGASALGFSMAECGARWLLPEPQIVRVSEVDHAGRRAAERERSVVTQVPHHPEEAVGSLYVDTPTGRRLRARTHVTIENHRLSGRRIEIETNSLGYRNRELGDKRGLRILFLGDSITFGDYVDEDQTFVRLVEARARAEGRDWETINAGVGGIGLDNEIAILLETGLATEPDVVVLDFYLNDFQASPGVRVARLSPPFDRSVLLRYLAEAYAAASAQIRLAVAGTDASKIDWAAWDEALAADWPPESGREEATFLRLARTHVHDWGGAFSPLVWDHLRPRLEELVWLSREHGFRLAVVMFPVRAQVITRAVYDAPQRRLEKELAALGVPALDLLPLLRSAHQGGGTPLFYDHCHPTPRGNALVAGAIDDFLVERVVPVARTAQTADPGRAAIP